MARHKWNRGKVFREKGDRARQPYPSTTCTEQEELTREMLKRVREVMPVLHPMHREVLSGVFYRGQSIECLADKYQMSVREVKGIYNEAIGALRGKIKPFAEENGLPMNVESA